MNSKQYGLTVTLVIVIALVGGICGAVLTHVFIGNPIFALERTREKVITEKVTTEKVITAEEIQVVDKDGKTRIKLFTLPNESLGIALYDKNSNARMWFGLLPDGTPNMQLYDKDGNPHIGLGLLSNGSPGINLLDKDGRIVWTVP